MTQLLNRHIQRTINNINNVDKDDEIDAELVSISSLDFVEKRKKLTKILENKDTGRMVKLKISNFFCNKLFNIYHIPLELFNILINTIFNIVYYGIELPTPVRLRYLRFQNEKISYESSVKLVNNSIRNILDHISYFQILKYILKNSIVDIETSQSILNEFEALFNNNTISSFIKMEIADIFLLNNREERGHEMLNILRGYNTVKHNVYNDSQNVHNKRVNETVLKSACKLIEIYKETEFNEDTIKRELMEISNISADSVKKVLERIEIDTSLFKYLNNSFNLYIVFANLWKFITLHKHEKELKIRLLEEIMSMELYCSTGHLSRFINVIQGFTDDPDLCINISNMDQMKSVVSNILDKELQNAPDNIMDSMIEDDKTLFINFVIEKINSKIPHLIKVYGDVENNEDDYDNILTAVINYTKESRIKFDKTEMLCLYI